MNLSAIETKIQSSDFQAFAQQSLATNPQDLTKRLLHLTQFFRKEYGDSNEIACFSVSGRTEICGNHTDHNHGLVVAAAVNADLLAVGTKRNDGTVHLHSVGYPEDIINLSTFTRPDPKRFFRSESLVAGMCSLFKKHGYVSGGFSAVTESQVPSGSGLSSSAAFEVAVGTILNHLYNDGKIPAEIIAQIAQEAENQFFGKPCGLMDQMACAVGGMISIDFKDPSHPIITPSHFSPESYGYVMTLTSTGGSHANLNEDYAAVPKEMKQIASFFQKEVLRDVDENAFFSAIPKLREQFGDRAVLRAIHFFDEDRRVIAMQQILSDSSENSMARFVKVLSASGQSSMMSLQNIYTTHDITHQGISLALAISNQILEGTVAGFRVHGGGFAGTVQAFLPKEKAALYKEKMDSVFGKDACRIFSIRPLGAARII